MDGLLLYDQQVVQIGFCDLGREAIADLRHGLDQRSAARAFGKFFSQPRNISGKRRFLYVGVSPDRVKQIVLFGCSTGIFDKIKQQIELFRCQSNGFTLTP